MEGVNGSSISESLIQNKLLVVIEESNSEILENVMNSNISSETKVVVEEASVEDSLSMTCMLCGVTYNTSHSSTNEDSQTQHCFNCRCRNIQSCESNRFRCKICGQNFSLKLTLLRHFKSHTNERQYQCQICNKRFKLTQNLQAHMRTHTGEKPYRCQFCDKSFGQASTLHKHVRCHTGESPYQCDFCGRYFKRNDSLLKHVRTHNKEKPFTCSICDKSFGRHDNLKVHMKSHKKHFKINS